MSPPVVPSQRHLTATQSFQKLVVLPYQKALLFHLSVAAVLHSWFLLGCVLRLYAQQRTPAKPPAVPGLPRGRTDMLALNTGDGHHPC